MDIVPAVAVMAAAVAAAGVRAKTAQEDTLLAAPAAHHHHHHLHQAMDHNRAVALAVAHLVLDWPVSKENKKQNY